VRILYLWDCENYEYYKEHGEYRKFEEKYGLKDESYLYNLFCKDYPQMAGGNVSATLRKAKQKYKDSKKEILSGQISLLSFKGNQPLCLRAKSIEVKQEQDNITARLLVFAEDYCKEKGYAGIEGKRDSRIRFQIKIDDNTQRSIIERLLNGTYSLGESQMVYDKGKKSWFILLSYTFTPNDNRLDPDKILGVDMGLKYAVFASSKGEHEVLCIRGDEVISKAKQIEARKKSFQKQARYCGKTRIGHGTKTRVAPAYAEGNYLENFRKTINDRYSRSVVDFAVKHGYGTIQLEDLSGIKADNDDESSEADTEWKHKLLQHWTYYDLQQKIIYKAKEQGIEVRKVSPKYTSQRCSACGYIDKGNRTSQADFKCLKCGFSKNADYNASQNLSIKGIDKIIEKELNSNCKKSAKPK